MPQLPQLPQPQNRTESQWTRINTDRDYPTCFSSRRQDAQHRKPRLNRKTLFVLGAMNLIVPWLPWLMVRRTGDFTASDGKAMVFFRTKVSIFQELLAVLMADFKPGVSSSQLAEPSSANAQVANYSIVFLRTQGYLQEVISDSNSLIQMIFSYVSWLSRCCSCCMNGPEDLPKPPRIAST